MISRAHRFHGYGSLKKVYREGKSVRGGLISLKYTNQNSDKPYRMAVVVSKKVHKSAVVRNRIRRRIYEVVRKLENQPKNGVDMVFTVFDEQIKDTPAPKLSKTLTDLVAKTD